MPLELPRPRLPVTVGRARAWASIGALLCLLAAWLFVPRVDPASEPDRPGLEAVVVDVSASASGPRPDWGRWVRRELARVARRAEAAGRELMVVEYARAPAVVHAAGDARLFAERLQGRGGAVYQPGRLAGASSGGAERALGSDLQAALSLVAPRLLAAGRAPGRLVLLSDGVGRGASPVGDLERLALGGVVLERPEPPRITRTDLGISRLRLPRRRIASGTSARIALELQLAMAAGEPPPSAVLLEVTARDMRSGSGSESGAPVSLREVTVEVPAGAAARASGEARAGGEASGTLRWSHELALGPLDDGLYELIVTARLPSGDGRDPLGDWLPGNDRAQGSLSVGGLPRVGVLTSGAGRASAAAFAERWSETLQLVQLDSDGLLAEVDLLDSLWTVDWPASELPALAVRRLLARGGGWLSCEGWESLTDGLTASLVEDGGGADEAGLHRLLPLRPLPEASEERDVVLLVDGSGSMVGEPFDRVREAVRRLALGARPSDHVKLRFFTGALGPVVFESFGATREERAARLDPLMEARSPGGSTDVQYALSTLASERAEAEDRRPALALLLTDGWTNYATDRPLQAREALTASGCDLRILAIGANPNRTYLRQLLFEGEELVEAGDLRRLVEILSEEVNRDLVEERPGAHLVFRDPAELPPASLAAGLVAAPHARQAAREDDGTRPPNGLPRLARMEPRPGAELLASSSTGSPVAAVDRVLAGTVISLGVSPWGEFVSPELAAQEDWLASLLLALSEGAAEPGGRAALSLEEQPGMAEDRLVLTLPEGLAPWWQLDLVGPGGESLEGLELLPDHASARPGRLVGGAPLELVGRPAGERWRWRARSRDGLEAREGWLVLPLAGEFREPTWTVPVALPEARSRPPGAARASFWAAPVLLLGLLLLFLSGLPLGDQGAGPGSREDG